MRDLEQRVHVFEVDLPELEYFSGLRMQARQIGIDVGRAEK